MWLILSTQHALVFLPFPSLATSSSSSTEQQKLCNSSSIDWRITKLFGNYMVAREAPVVWDGLDCGPLAGNPWSWRAPAQCPFAFWKRTLGDRSEHGQPLLQPTQCWHPSNSSVPQIILEYRLCARSCPRCWGCHDRQNQPSSNFHGACLVGETDSSRANIKL